MRGFPSQPIFAAARYISALLAWLLAFACIAGRVNAYYTNMPASVVVGQPDFSTNSAAITQTKLNAPSHAFVDSRHRLIVSEFNNHRVLIWNSVPTTNGVPADLVIGQNDFVSSSINKGGNIGADTVNSPSDVYSDGQRLFVADTNNRRVLIWNEFPTQNGQAADVVVGKGSMIDGTTTTCDQSTTNAINGMDVFGNTLIVQAAGQRRILIWNSVPTTNGQPADVVVGQPDFTTCSAVAASQRTIVGGLGLSIDPTGRLIVADNSSRRVLVWNRIPGTNFQSATLVLGQSDFLASGDQPISAGTFGNSLRKPASNGRRLFIADGANNRILMWNSFPTMNGANADAILGQQDFVSGLANGGETVSASVFSGPLRISIYDDKLIVADPGNNRVLIFNNSLPASGLSDHIIGQPDGKLRFSGTATTNLTNQIIKRVEYSVNGSTWTGGFPSDGKFDSSTEDYFFDFDPSINTMADNQGYTVKIRATHDNDKDVGASTLYFEPFQANSPLNNSFTLNRLPSFTFTVQKFRFSDLKENLDHFRVMVRKDGEDWQPYIDYIPVDYNSVRLHPDNARPNQVDTMNGTYEDKFKTVTYDQDNSVITVLAKAVDSQGNASDKFWENGGMLLNNATYQWKIQTQDHAGQLQETEPRTLRIGTRQVVTSRPYFLLSIYAISGVPGYFDISTNHPEDAPKVLTMTTNHPKSAPTFAGHAFAGSTVTFAITDTTLATSSACLAATPDPRCTQTYQTTVSPDSSFRYTVPKAFRPGNSYDVTVSVKDTGDNYNELPTFQLTVQ